MLRQGPISAFMHGVIEYVAGALFIAAPFLFSFDSDAARALSIVLGVAILIVTASSDLPTGLSKTLPVTVHAVFDLLLSVFLIAAPFVFDFSDQNGPTAFFIVLGVAHLLLSIATRYLPPRQVSGGAGRTIGS
jgi:hypothetical protein